MDKIIKENQIQVKINNKLIQKIIFDEYKKIYFNIAYRENLFVITKNSNSNVFDMYHFIINSKLKKKITKKQIIAYFEIPHFTTLKNIKVLNIKSDRNMINGLICENNNILYQTKIFGKPQKLPKLNNRKKINYIRYIDDYINITFDHEFIKIYNSSDSYISKHYHCSDKFYISNIYSLIDNNILFVYLYFSEYPCHLIAGNYIWLLSEQSNTYNYINIYRFDISNYKK